MTAPQSSAPTVSATAPGACVCGENKWRERYAGSAPFFDKIRRYKCGSEFSSKTGWKRPCLPAFHAAAAAREREQALVAVLEMALDCDYHTGLCPDCRLRVTDALAALRTEPATAPATGDGGGETVPAGESVRGQPSGTAANANAGDRPA